MSLQYIYQRGHPRRVMHFTELDKFGEPTMRSLCRIGIPFDTTINVPLGQKICRNCRRELVKMEAPHA